MNNDSIPVYGESDVLVVGGGVAGIGAAVAAARQGKKVTLIEKSIVLGGLATLGHVCIYLALDDGAGNKVYYGLAEELFHVCIKYGYNTLDEEWKGCPDTIDKIGPRYKSNFNIPAAIMAFDELMDEEGITVLYDVLFSEPIMEGNTAKGIIFDSKQGRMKYLAKQIIDASGDADVMYRAGAECAEQDSIVSHWCFEADFDTLKEGLEAKDMLKAIPLRWIGLTPAAYLKDESQLTRFPGTTVDGVNGYVRLSRQLAIDHLKKRDQINGYQMLSLPFMPQFRMTRRIVGEKTFELNADTYLEDSVGIVSYCLKNPSPVYEFPYGALVDKKIDNIIAAGRIVAAEGEGWEMMRLIPPAVFTGEVAGIAAAMAIDDNCSIRKVDIKKLQQKLEKNGILIHIPERMKGNVNTVDLSVAPSNTTFVHDELENAGNEHAM